MTPMFDFNLERIEEKVRHEWAYFEAMPAMKMDEQFIEDHSWYLVITFQCGCRISDAVVSGETMGLTIPYTCGEHDSTPGEQG